MSMNREAYRLANEIGAELGADRDCLIDNLEDMDMKKYQTAVLDEIRKEKRRKKSGYQGLAVAACAALMVLVGTAAFGDQVHAAIQQISWSIGSALGISADLSDYREVVNTSVSDKGYVVTLQEAVVSEGTLVTNYTVQREDGQPLTWDQIPDGCLYINGEMLSPGGSGSADYLDEEEKVIGIVESYQIPDGVDLSQDTAFRLSFGRIGYENSVKGKWEFAFTANGADLIAGTRRVELGKEFELPDGVKVTLDEFTCNDLEQRITFSKSGGTRYLLMVTAKNQEGKQVEFGVRSSDEKSGYMQNEEILYDGRMDDTEGNVWTMTLYAVELPEGNGRISDDYVQVGESFVLEF